MRPADSFCAARKHLLLGGKNIFLQFILGGNNIFLPTLLSQNNGRQNGLISRMLLSELYTLFSGIKRNF